MRSIALPQATDGIYKIPISPSMRKTQQNILFNIVKNSLLLILKIVPPILQSYGVFMTDSLLYGLCFAAVWGLPIICLAWYITGPSRFQINEYKNAVKDALRRGDDAANVRIVLSFQQKWTRGYAMLIALLSTAIGSYIFSVSGPVNGLLEAGGACVFVSVLVVVVGAVFSPFLTPETAYADQGAWLVRAREKHADIRKYGWPGKPGGRA